MRGREGRGLPCSTHLPLLGRSEDAGVGFAAFLVGRGSPPSLCAASFVGRLLRRPPPLLSPAPQIARDRRTAWGEGRFAAPADGAQLLPAEEEGEGRGGGGARRER